MTTSTWLNTAYGISALVSQFQATVIPDLAPDSTIERAIVFLDLRMEQTLPSGTVEPLWKPTCVQLALRTAADAGIGPTDGDLLARTSDTIFWSGFNWTTTVSTPPGDPLQVNHEAARDVHQFDNSGRRNISDHGYDHGALWVAFGDIDGVGFPSGFTSRPFVGSAMVSVLVSTP